jgi:hypothetical protein
MRHRRIETLRELTDARLAERRFGGREQVIHDARDEQDKPQRESDRTGGLPLQHGRSRRRRLFAASISLRDAGYWSVPGLSGPAPGRG